MTWDDLTAAWDAVASAASAAWTSAYESAIATYEDLVKSDPKGSADQVVRFMAELEETRGLLDRMASQLPKPPVTPEDHALHKRYAAYEARYHEIAAGFYRDVEANQAPQVGVVPVLAVAGLAIGLGAATWSFAGYEYAVNLREETALASRELDARIQASKEGRTIQESTLPEPASSASNMTTMMMGGAAVLGGLVLIMNLKRS